MDLADRTVMLLGGSGQANVRALAGSKAPVLAEAAWRLLATDDALRQQIISVGLPIVAPDGKTVYRGSSVVVPPDPRVRAATWSGTRSSLKSRSSPPASRRGSLRSKTRGRVSGADGH